MRILFFSEQFWPECNAPAIHVHERARIWARQGHEITVITSAPNFPEGRVWPGYRNRWRFVEYVDGIRVVRVKTFIAQNQGLLRRALDYASYALSAFFFSFLENRPDVIISTSPQLLTPLAGLFTALLRRVPHVFELRDLWPASLVGVEMASSGPFVRGLTLLEMWCYRRSRRILAFTRAFKEDLVARGIPPEKIDVVLNGVSLDIFQPRAKNLELLRAMAPQGSFVVGYFGTLGLAHALQSVLEAAQELRDDPVFFLFAGPGAARSELEQLAETKALKNVRFLPRQERSAMPELLGICDAALVHLKDKEVFRSVIPSKLFEACAMGIPVLYAGPDGEAGALIRENGMGATLPPEDPMALAAQIRHWMANPTLHAKVAEANLKARHAFGRKAQAEACLGVLHRALAQKG